MINSDMPVMPITESMSVGDVSKTEVISGGLTKREMFAMHAMANMKLGDYEKAEHLAQDAITKADALLKELEK